jgi:hypothetical protein
MLVQCAPPVYVSERPVAYNALTYLGIKPGANDCEGLTSAS